MEERAGDLNSRQRTIDNSGTLSTKTNSLLQGRACKLVIQYHMISPENRPRSNTVETENGILIYLRIHVYKPHLTRDNMDFD